ncbi:MAG: hypothetical protein JW821_02180 [Deltaproteobacteria bacterium]|nr:hypothetical protein [Deltaproteobacteria bacterium]
MKRLFAILIAALFLAGCGTLAKDSEFWQHDTMYKNWDHTLFSLGKYKDCASEDVKKGKDQGWWGVEPKECQPK